MASPALRKTKQASMSYIPVAIQQLHLAAANQEAERFGKVPKGSQVALLNFITPKFTCEAAI